MTIVKKYYAFVFMLASFMFGAEVMTENAVKAYEGRK